MSESLKIGNMFKPVRTRSVSEAVFEQLRDQIVRGDLQPGSQLPGERRLSELLGANRGGVREALKRLVQAGLVTTQHGGATRVLDYRRAGTLDLLRELIVDPEGDVDREVLRHALELQLAISPMTARLAARNSDRTLHDRLRKQLEFMSAVQHDGAQLERLAREFLDLCAESCGNVALQLVHNTLRAVFERTCQMRGVPEARPHTLENFIATAEAIEQRDEARAERLTRERLEAYTQQLTLRP